MLTHVEYFSNFHVYLHGTQSLFSSDDFMLRWCIMKTLFEKKKQTAKIILTTVILSSRDIVIHTFSTQYYHIISDRGYNDIFLDNAYLVHSQYFWFL